MKTDVYSTSGKKIDQIILPEEIFGLKPKKLLIAQAVRVYLSNQRQASAKTKTRGELAFSKHKLWRQKGTGRARHGSRSAPIFVKGAKAHGPTGEQNYKLSLPKNVKRKALYSALSEKLKSKELLFVQGLEKVPPKTKDLKKILDKFYPKEKKSKIISLVLPKKMENIYRAGRNIPYLKIYLANDLNPYLVLRSTLMLFAKESLSILKR